MLFSSGIRCHIRGRIFENPKIQKFTRGADPPNPFLAGGVPPYPFLRRTRANGPQRVQLNKGKNKWHEHSQWH